MRKRIRLATLFMSLCFAVSAWAQPSASKEECVIKCHEAAALINFKGLAAAAKEIGEPKGAFVWKDSYVFMMNLDGKMLAHPMQPELTQLPHCLLITDPTDKAIFVSFVNMARNVGQGWVEYHVAAARPEDAFEEDYLHLPGSREGRLRGRGRVRGGTMY